MKNRKISNDNFITMIGFMVNDLHLKGNELIIYACIYGFSQNKGKFDGSLEYLSQWTNSSKQSMMNCLKSLEDKGLISKKEFFDNKVKRCVYSATEKRVYNKVEEPMQQSCTGYVTKLDSGMQQSCTNTMLDIDTNKEDINNIPAEENKDNISLLTSDDTMYESKKTNIELNCTLPINDVIIPVEKPKKKSKSNFQSNPDKYTWINARVKEFNEGLPKDRQFARPNKSGKTREEKAGNTHILGVVYDKFGEEKATEFFNYIVAKGEWRNPYSISSLKNQEEFENFYQDPQEEQPKYLGTKIGSAVERFKNYQEEPSSGVFVNEEYFYAALEQFYSNQFSGTELVKKVRERVKEINCKYKNY